jgi:hypothetical protein
MVTLTEAMGASALRAAFCDVDATMRLTVQEVSDGSQLGGRSRYAVTVQRGAGMPQRLAEVASLDEALAQISGLGLAGFDAEHADWQPAGSGSATSSATWADDVGTRTLPPIDEPEDAAPGSNREVPPEDVYDPLM